MPAASDHPTNLLQASTRTRPGPDSMNHDCMTTWESFTPTTSCSASATSTATANLGALKLSYRMCMCMITLPHQRVPHGARYDTLERHPPGRLDHRPGAPRRPQRLTPLGVPATGLAWTTPTTNDAGNPAAWASKPYLHNKNLKLTIDAACILSVTLYDYFVRCDLDHGATSYAVGMSARLEDMLGRAADEIPRHWVAVTTADDPHCAPQRDGALRPGT